MVTSTHLDSLRPRLTHYIPHTPTAKQRAFLILPHEEAFFGGAAGGGKSDALLACCLQWVDIPGYSSVIIRKTLKDAREPGSIMSRARDWLGHTNAQWSGIENSWYFPTSGVSSRMVFGKLGQIGDTDTFQGAAFQTICFDEITQLYEIDCDYVMSRLRRNKCPKHKKDFSDSCKTCAEYYNLSKVPMRIRTASNPGGKGHGWVKRRYDIRKIEGKLTPNGRQLYAGRNPDMPHIPAYVHDNPYLDVEEYMKRLGKIKDPVTREQLLSGDWGVADEGRFKIGWVRRYHEKPPYIEMEGGETYHENTLQTFIIIDPAASKKSAPGTKSLTKKIASHTAAGVFSITQDGNMLLRRVERHQGEVPETKHMIRRLITRYPQTQFVGMEFTSMSTHLYQVLAAEGFSMKAFTHGGSDKIARCVTATNEMESGRYWFPDNPSVWLQDYEDELFIWTGDPDEVDDQVDITSYAAMHKHQQQAYGYSSLSYDDLPSLI